jgi:hypothetical protein
MSQEEENRFKVRIEKEKYRVLPTGVYRAMLVEITTDMGKFEQPIFRLTFRITEKNLESRRLFINGLINASENGERGKLWQLKKAFDDVECKIGDAFDIRAFLNKECFIHVEQKEHKNAITEYIPRRNLDDIGKK